MKKSMALFAEADRYILGSTISIHEYLNIYQSLTSHRAAHGELSTTLHLFAFCRSASQLMNEMWSDAERVMRFGLIVQACNFLQG